MDERDELFCLFMPLLKKVVPNGGDADLITFFDELLWTLVPVMRCLAVVRSLHSKRISSILGATISITGSRFCLRAVLLLALGFLRYLATALRLTPISLAHRADALALQKHFVPDDVYLIHPQHPSSSSAPGTSSGTLPDWGRGWLSFSALRGSIFLPTFSKVKNLSRKVGARTQETLIETIGGAFVAVGIQDVRGFSPTIETASWHRNHKAL